MANFLRRPVNVFFIFPLIAGLLLLFLPKDPSQIKENQLSSVEDNLVKQIKLLEEEGEQVASVILDDSLNFIYATKNTTFPFILYKNRQLIGWNTNHVVPAYRYVKGSFTYSFLRMPGGQYVGRKWVLGQYELIGLLPLYKDYKISNKYVESHYNKKIFSFTPERLVEMTLETGLKVCYKEQCLFQVAFASENVIPSVTRQEWLGALLILISYISLLWLVIVYRKKIFRHFKALSGSIFILFLFIIPRLLMLFLDFPRKYFSLPLFDTTAFASSWINPTLGDLLLNLITILLLVLLLYDNRDYMLKRISHSKGTNMWLLLFSLIYFFSALLLFILIQTIYHNSQISIDITQSLNYDQLRIATFIILISSTVLLFLLGHLYMLLQTQVCSNDRQRIILTGSAFVIFILIAFIENLEYLFPITVAVLFNVIIYFTKLYKTLNKIRFATFIYVFSWAVAAALIIAFATVEFEEEREYNNQIKFADKFLLESDALAEYLLHDFNQKVEDDLFIQNRLSSPYLGKDVVKDKIRQVYLGGYFDKYDINIYLFDSQGRSYNPQDFVLRPSDIRINNQKFATQHKNIYYIDDPNDQVAGRFLDLIEIKKRGIRVGYILLDLRLKKFIPEDVYPELLVDHRFLQPFQNKSYSYALYNDGVIEFTSGDFNYESNFEKGLLARRALFDKGIKFKGYQHRAVEDHDNKIYVISIAAHDFEHLFSNFSFFFLIIVSVVMVVSAIYSMIFVIKGGELYYSARIQLYLSLAFFIPMVIVTIVTLSLVNRSFKEEVNRENEKKAENMARSIADEIMHTPFEDQLVNVLSKASQYADADANIFSPQGKLLASTQPMIYENHLMAEYINPVALHKILVKNEKIYTAAEAVGTLKFNTTYFGIKSPDTGRIIGILSVPYFESEAALERNEIEIFTNIISVFTIIFLLFLIVSYLASEYLTFPLKIITKKLQKTSLDFNEPLSWESNDEIGLMVKEYNRMLINLEESKKALARNEKESAWREMAQQVAHEIKNPLTPMKLTLQHLQRTAVNMDDQWKRSIVTLLHQVDTLNEIASSFSAFARMPSPSKERFNLETLVQNSVNLFTNTSGIDLHYSGTGKKLIIEADEQLLGRIISNILINAIEAGEGYHPLRIDIKVEIEQKNKALLSISDNGPGIEESVKEKIFAPHFSTKKAGSGIGLAIARRGVEHAGGEIWFETEERKGTTFFIRLPLVNVQ